MRPRKWAGGAYFGKECAIANGRSSRGYGLLSVRGYAASSQYAATPRLGP